MLIRFARCTRDMRQGGGCKKWEWGISTEVATLFGLNMGLPVEEIMAEVEEELMNMNEEELDHMDGEVHEDGEELNEDKEKDLDGIKLEVVEDNKEGSRWLIVDSVHICHKQQVFLNHDVWRCEDFRDYKCPFKIILTR